MKFACSGALMLLAAATAMAQPRSSGWTLNGSAKLQKLPGNGGYRLRLTPDQTWQAGSAFVSEPVSFHAGNTFSYYFKFQMTNPNFQASDGMTFVLQTEGPDALGANGGCLGYAWTSGCSGATSGIAPSVAIEFDDYQNSPFDNNSNHVAILTNGQLNDTDPQSPYGVTNCQPSGKFGCMNNGDIWSVWVDFDGTTLHVAVADDSTLRPANLIDYAIDIPGILSQTSAYIGFTAGTGEGAENHYVMNFRPGNPLP